MNIFTVYICKKHCDQLCIIIDGVATKFVVIVLMEARKGLRNLYNN